MKDYDEVIRRSIRKDFAKANFKRNGRAPREPRPANTKRIVYVDDSSEYAKFRKLLLGKIVRLKSVSVTGSGVWVMFVNDNDRKRLNRAAGWSNEKMLYLLYGVKFDD